MSSTLKTLTALFLSLNLISVRLLAQDDNDPGKQTQTKNKRVVKAAKDKRDKMSAELDLKFGWDSNIFKTPSVQYIDPITGNPTKHTAQSGEVVNPDITLTYAAIQNKKFDLDLSYNYDGEFYFGAKNASNASGNDQVLEAKSKFTFVDNKKATIEKIQLKAALYASKHQYAYYDRGTGAKRVTSSATAEEDRYNRTETGIKLEPKFKFSSDTDVSFPFKVYKRDYEEVGTLQSYDRTGTVYEINVKQHLGDKWSVHAMANQEAVEYDSHKAYSATGTSVPGTTRKYTDQENLLGFDYETKRYFGGLSYRTVVRDDEYAGYWSYSQDKVALEVGKYFSKKSSLSIEGSTMNRSYDKETAPSGEIRDRNFQTYALSYEYERKDDKISLDIVQSTQSDTDKYYEYDKTLILIGYNREF